MSSKSRQHWLPRAYLRQFRAGPAETIFMLDLFASPVWREVGLNDICNTRGYHATAATDQRLDSELLKRYATIISKVTGLRQHAALDSVLEAAEIADLQRFFDVHLFRSPLSSYRMLFHTVREHLVEDPSGMLPEDIRVGFPRLYNAIEALRAACDEDDGLDSTGREDVALAWVHQKMEEDGSAHNLMRMPEEFDEMLIKQLGSPPIRTFRYQSVLYSDAELFTTDNPFVLSGSADGEAMQLACLLRIICSRFPTTRSGAMWSRSTSLRRFHI